MRHVSYIVAIATLAGAVAGCADPYYRRSGYSQGYNYTPGYSNYPSANYRYSQPSYAYSQPSYPTASPATSLEPAQNPYRSSAWINYNGITPGRNKPFQT
jgi:hypothetical protein